ncbi:MAG: GGDEF domain-containing protein [Burkholderiales bacterium]|nr:GGDEF domain-containing protein [Burkholderiales bacterium]
MNFLARRLRSLQSRLVERHDAGNVVLFVLGLWPMLAVLWALQAAAWWVEPVRALYQPALLPSAHVLLSLLMAWLAFMGWVGWRRRHDPSPQPWLVQLTLVPGIGTLVGLSVGHGLHDNPLSMLILDVLVLSRALFPLRVLRAAWGLALGMALLSEVLQGVGALVYAPLLIQPIFVGEALHPWWAMWVRVIFSMAVLILSAVLFLLAHTLRRRRAELETLVRTDMLTGLANRREFMTGLERESLRQARSGRPLSVVLFDVDHFKRINDTWGHPVGDEVLARIGALLRSHTRDQVDTAARYGGEEFVLLLPDTSLDGAQLVAEKIAARLRDEVFDACGQRFLVTQSVGIAQVVEGDGGWALRVADRNLYQAKQAGRDRIVASMAFKEDDAMSPHP